ncbi:hypothetical protein [Micromonospora sp. CPCC 205556]|uniref:hypothetical protein n=1 Tax=Micromonospora sp. CPCC 205556 TaxID=3122398 RepID=UPI002FF15427
MHAAVPPAPSPIAEYREWPDRLDWDEGPDVLRYPDLYDPISDAQDDEVDPVIRRF